MTNNLNILSYLNAASTASVDAKNATQKTSYMDKSSDFNNILDNANKGYVADEKNTQYDYQKADSQRLEERKSSDATLQARDEQRNIDKKNELNSRKTDEFSKADKTDNLKEKIKDKVEDKTEPKENNVSKKETDKTDAKVVKKDEASVDDLAKPDGKTEVKADNKTQPTEEASLSQAKNQTQGQVITVDTLVNATIASLAQVDKSNTAEAKIDSQGTTKDKTQAVPQANVGAQPLAEATFDVDASQLAKENFKNKAQPEGIKVQPQTQQVLLNLKVDAEKGANSTANQVASTQQNPTDLKTLSQDVSTQTPLVQANAEIATNLGGVSKAKQAIMDAFEKAGLVQDMVDKLNVKVTGVQTSGSSGKDLLGQQNAQEQGVKMALENSSLLNSSNAGTQTGATTQTTFDKTLDNAQQPKELNKADVLSQIHTKMEALKEEGTTKVTIVLRPENLGKISLELINGKDGLTARMTTENHQVKELLDKNLEGLRNSLGGQGVSVNNVSIKVAETQEQSNATFDFQQKQQGAQEQGKQQSSNNSQKFDMGQFSSEEEFVNTADNTGSEETVKTSLHAGQVDYKI